MEARLTPTRSTFDPDEPVELDAVGVDGPVRLVVSRGAVVVHDGTVTPVQGRISLGRKPVGGYGVTVEVDGTVVAATAFDVLESPRERPRYGFVSEFPPARADVAETAESLRSLHLNVVQFYDWAYRHAHLVSDDDEFVDPIGRPLSHETARRLIEACHGIGALALGYAAVYGVGHDHAAAHPDQLLYHHDGTPWQLADVLEIGNLARGNPWRAVILDQLAEAVERMGFDGLHLDTYGSPKIAWDDEGRAVDLAAVFPGFLREVRDALPDATLYFNNVNDYPTWTSAAAPLDSTYVEVWDPHTDYVHLRGLVQAGQLRAPGRPVVLAAYLKAFALADDDAARWSARLALAVVFAQGAHYLLCGENGAVLTHPYYPNFARPGAETTALLRQWFDFAVAQGDLLHDPDAADVTHSHLASAENDDLAVESGAPVSPDPLAGRLWTSLRRTPGSSTVHVVDLTAQTDAVWNTPKTVGSARDGVTVRLRTGGEAAFVGSPEWGPHLRPAEARREGDHLVVTVPAFTAWVVVHVPDAP